MVALITGPSGSGKTNRLLKSLTNAKKYGQKHVLVKPLFPGYDPSVKLSGTSLELDVPVVIYGRDTIPTEDIEDEEYHFIFVDDTHLFSVEEVQAMLDNLAPLTRNLVFYGPQLDYSGIPFESVQYLIDGEGEYVDYVEVLTVPCSRCSRNTATMTQRLINKAPAGWSPRIFFDEAVEHIPVCENCWQKPY